MSLRFFPVYINHIAGSVNAADLRSLFARFGSVIDVVIVDEYGFVNMKTCEDACLVIQELNGRGLHSSLLHVDFSEEMKQYLLNRGVTFRCTPDPYSGVVGEQHPNYPSGEGIVQPNLSEPGYGSLMDNKEYLDERLKIINAELAKLKDSPSTSEPRPRRSKSRDRSYHRKRSTSRTRSRRSGSNSRTRDKRSKSRRRISREDLYHDRNTYEGERSRDYDNDPRLSVDRERIRYSGSRSSGLPREGSRSDRDLFHRRDSIPPTRGSNPGFSNSKSKRRRNRRRHVEHLNTPQRKSALSRLGDIVPASREEANLSEISDNEIINPEEEAESELELSDEFVEDNHRRPSGEFEDGADIDLSRKNMKIQINIGSKNMNDMTRKIMVDLEEQTRVQRFMIKYWFVSDTSPQFREEIKVLKFESLHDPEPLSVVEVECTAPQVEEAYSQILKSLPEDTSICIYNSAGENIKNNGSEYSIILINRTFPSSVELLLRESGIVKLLTNNGSTGRVQFASICQDHLIKLILDFQAGLAGETVSATFADIKSQLLLEELILKKNPDAKLRHKLQMEGLGLQIEDSKRYSKTKKRIVSLMKPHCLVLNMEVEGSSVQIEILSTRKDAIAFCVELTNTFLFGNRIYLSAKSSKDIRFKEEVEKILMDKFGNRLKELENEIMINIREAEADISTVDKSKVIREIDMYVDGTRNMMGRDGFEELFNDYGMVVHEHSKPDLRYSFVTLFSTEEKALKSCYELTGRRMGDNSLVVEISQRERHDLSNESKALAKKKLAEVRKKDQEERALMMENDDGTSLRKYYLYLDGLTSPREKYEIASLFEPYGKIIKALPNEDKYYTFVDLETTEENAINAVLNVSGIDFFGNALKVQFRKNKGMTKVIEKLTERLKNPNLALNTMNRKRGMDMSVPIEYPSQYTKQSKVDIPDSVKSLMMPNLDDDSIIPRFKELVSFKLLLLSYNSRSIGFSYILDYF